MGIKFLIADDHKLFREGLKALLEKIRGIEWIAEAADGMEAVKIALAKNPDLIIMDVSMPKLNGIEATKQILAEKPDARIIVLSMHSDRRFVTEALKSGVMGYLLKDSAFEELNLAIRAAMEKRNFLSSTITEMVVTDFVKHNCAKELPSAFDILSARERQVLQLLAEGVGTKGVASRLEISVKTVETHRKQIMDKLNLYTIAELTKFAVREGLTAL
jgi:DNA-binding NarL/FixJ family response regulator